MPQKSQKNNKKQQKIIEIKKKKNLEDFKKPVFSSNNIIFFLNIIILSYVSRLIFLFICPSHIVGTFEFRKKLYLLIFEESIN